MMLLNYDACVKDCLAALSKEPAHLKSMQRLAKAYALVGQYKQAVKWYAGALEIVGVATSAALRTQIEEEMASVPTIEKIRKFVDTEQYGEALQLVAKLKGLANEAPILLLRCVALTMVDPSQARAELSKYYQTLEYPHSANANDMVLTGNAANHYCEVLVLLARSSFYCGQHYLNISTTYLKQCTALRPDYRPATLLLKVISAMEQRIAEIATLMQNFKWSEAHATITLALGLDLGNRKIRSGLFHQRAEAAVKLGNTAAAISDCTSALECDPSNVKALARRSKCFVDIGDFTRALRDMERATELNPAMADELNMLKRQFHDDASSFANFQRKCSAGFGRKFEYTRQEGEGSSFFQRFTSASSSRPTTQQGERCLYSALDLPRFAAVEQVKMQYKKLILQYHPDKVVNQPPEVKERCAAKFKEISHAYSVLSDVAGKFTYDSQYR
jgi:tetratricopeptide (TPR) repeat protein